MLISETHPPKLMCSPNLDFLLDLCLSGLATPCRDLCVLKKFADAPNSLTSDKLYVLALYDWIKTCKGPADQTPQEKGD